ncbi:MAG TPA: energy transducer TonB [Sphingomicrobium sp.]|nr:energy transducer TonB [Sphingomicrobium sp.]
MRQYGAADRPTTLALKAPPTGHALQLAIIRPAYRKTSDQVGAKVDLDGKIFATYALGYPLGYPAKSSKQSVSLIHLPSDASETIRTARNLRLDIKGSFIDGFPLGEIGKAWTAMDACLARLRQTWNLEESGPAKIGTGPRPLVPIQGMITGMDFPRQVLGKVWSGATSFVLLIDETGKVRDCTLTESSGIAVIDSRTCAVITYKARFDPAIGLDGKPVKSAFPQRITWRVTD